MEKGAFMETATGNSQDMPSLAGDESSLRAAALDEWKFYVRIAAQLGDDQVSGYCETLAARLLIGKDSVYRRIAAIRYAHAQGQEWGAIIAQGQEKTLSEWMLSKKKEKTEKDVTIGYRIPNTLKAKFDEDMERIKKLLNIVTSADYFEFLHSLLSSLSDADIQHAAGGKE
jgi:hypothetical protein